MKRPVDSAPCSCCGGRRRRGSQAVCAICEAPLCTSRSESCSVSAPHLKHRRVCVMGDCHKKALAIAKANFERDSAERRARLDALLKKTARVVEAEPPLAINE